MSDGVTEAYVRMLKFLIVVMVTAGGCILIARLFNITSEWAQDLVILGPTALVFSGGLWLEDRRRRGARK